jgi:hypothetical protein
MIVGVLMRVRTSFVFAAASILMAACGSQSDGPASNAASPPTAEKADVTIVLDGAQHACVVSLASEAQGSSIPCKDVVAFIRDELRIASGSSYDLHQRGAEEAEVAIVRATLKDAGYRPVGGRDAGPK